MSTINTNTIINTRDQSGIRTRQACLDWAVGLVASRIAPGPKKQSGNGMLSRERIAGG